MFKIPSIKSKQAKSTFMFGTIVGGGLISVLALMYPEYNPAFYFQNLLNKKG